MNELREADELKPDCAGTIPDLAGK